MNYITFNNYKLPIMGSKITDATHEEKNEYLRLLNQVAKTKNLKFQGNFNFYGVPYKDFNDHNNWIFSSQVEASEYFKTLLPIQEAILWLKLAVGEITDWVVDLIAERNHSRLEEFKSWYNNKFSDQYVFNLRYYGIDNGDVQWYGDNPSQTIDIPIITLDQFFAYLHERPVSEPKAGELTATEFIDKLKSIPNFTAKNLKIKLENGSVIIGEISIKTEEPPQPDPAEIRRKEAKEKAKEWIEKNINLLGDYVNVLTQYIIDQEK